MKRINTRRIKAKLSYRVPVFAELVGVTPNTVLGWIKNEGLQRLEGVYPYMVHGEAVIAFLKDRRLKKQITLLPHEFRCCTCQAARNATEGVATLHTTASQKPMLRANCDQCGGAMCKFISVKNRAEIEKCLHIHTLHESALVQSTNTNTNH